ncbi:MAG: biotin/lipoyl-binding protein [Candidatus Contubernalis sp.]|nr:biotin/lipoyl-binding protein [Candidatus Contubernalis sp.]
MRRKVLAGLVCLLFIWSGAMGCSPSQVEGESSVQKPAVMVSQALKGEIQETVVLSGQVTPRVHINVIPEIAGKVEKVEVQEGDSVTKGQLLAQLDSESQKLQLEQARTALRLAQAQLEHARESYALQEQNRELASRSDQGNKDYQEQYKKLEELYMEGKITEEELKNFQSLMVQSQEQCQFSQSELAGLSPQQIDMMEIQVEQARIQVKLA